MEIDRRRIRRINQPRPAHERVLARVIRRGAWLDRIGEPLQRAVGAFYMALGAPGRAVKNVMHGTTILGHPLHPAITDVPMGAWTAGIVADWLFVSTGRIPAVAGDLALGVGVGAAVVAAIAGYTDFHETDGQERRTATLHGLTMTTVLVIETASLALRLWVPGARMGAIILSTAGWLLATVGAYVGGYLTFGIGSAVNHNAFTGGPADYVKVGTRNDFREGEMKRVDAGGLPVVILRRIGLLYAIGAVCSHAGGPLDEGKVEGSVVTCPWHGSTFCFDDGRVMDGPATFPQPPLKVRERGGIVEVKLARPVS
ncbi:MAG: Rieske 2Fe-2S domain-containing protein [Candidatus Dormibacteraceae bacterium]